MILFSIVTINFNNADKLEKTISSVLNQTFQNFEYIIIDGGSKDKSVEIIQKYSSRLTYWISETDNGIYNAMNKGIEQCKGKWCMFLNSGDFLASNDILEKISKVNYPQTTGIIFGDWFDYSPIKTELRKPFPFFENGSYLHHKGICHQSSFTRTDLAKRYKFDESFKIAADYKMFYDIYHDNYSLNYINLPICYFEINVGVSQRHSKIAFKEDAKILHRYRTLKYYYYYFKKFFYHKIKNIYDK